MIYRSEGPVVVGRMIRVVETLMMRGREVILMNIQEFEIAKRAIEFNAGFSVRIVI